MKSTSARKILSALLVICLAVLIVPVFATPAGAETKTYTMHADDLEAFAAGAKADGETRNQRDGALLALFKNEQADHAADDGVYDDGEHGHVEKAGGRGGEKRNRDRQNHVHNDGQAALDQLGNEQDSKRCGHEIGADVANEQACADHDHAD